MRKFLFFLLLFSFVGFVSAQVARTTAKMSILGQGTVSAVALENEQLVASYNATQHTFAFRAKSDVFYVNANTNQQKVNNEVFGGAVKVMWAISVDASSWNGTDVVGLMLPVTITYNGHQVIVNAPIDLSTVNQKTVFAAAIPLDITTLGLSLGNNGDIFSQNVSLNITNCTL